MNKHTEGNSVSRLLRVLQDKHVELDNEGNEVQLRLTAEPPIEVVTIPTFDPAVFSSPLN
jgi:hypothetical protein